MNPEDLVGLPVILEREDGTRVAGHVESAEKVGDEWRFIIKPVLHS